MAFELPFKNKKVPLITRGRIQHFLFAFLMVWLPGAISYWLHWTDDMMTVSQWAAVFVFFYGLAWESSTSWMSKHIFTKWDHPYGDPFDFFAYYVGLVLAVVPMSLMGC